MGRHRLLPPGTWSAPSGGFNKSRCRGGGCARIPAVSWEPRLFSCFHHEAGRRHHPVCRDICVLGLRVAAEAPVDDGGTQDQTRLDLGHLRPEPERSLFAGRNVCEGERQSLPGVTGGGEPFAHVCLGVQ